MRDAGTTKPFISISSRQAIIEGDEAVFTLTANPPPAETIAVDVQVVESGDFVSRGDDGVQVVYVYSDGTGTLRVQTEDDTDDERDGTIKATLRSGSDYAVGSPKSATVQVNDDDVEAGDRTVSIADAELAENDRETWSMSFEVTLSEPAGEWVLVVYETRETTNTFNNATADEDYWSGKGHVLFLPGEATVKQARVRLVDDDEYEEAETFEVTILDVLGPAEIADGSAIGTILPDPFDAPRDTPTFTIEADAAATEGGEITFYLFVEPPPKDDMTVNINISDAEGSDFVADDDEGPRAVTFLGDASLVPSTAQKFTISTVDDSVDGENGAVFIEITDPDEDGADYYIGAPHSVSTIVYDNDGAPAQLPMIAVTDTLASEASGTIWFSVTVTPPVPEHGTVRVHYTTQPDTARQGEDYVRTFGELVFSGNENLKYVVIPIIDDNDQEGDETLVLRLYSPEGATIADDKGVGTIEASD